MRFPIPRIPPCLLLEAVAAAGAVTLVVAGGFFLAILLSPPFSPDRHAQFERWAAQQQEAVK